MITILQIYITSAILHAVSLFVCQQGSHLLEVHILTQPATNITMSLFIKTCLQPQSVKYVRNKDAHNVIHIYMYLSKVESQIQYKHQVAG